MKNPTDRAEDRARRTAFGGHDLPHVDLEEGTAEEHDFEVSNAMASLESLDERAARREHDAAEARGEIESHGPAFEEPDGD